MTSFDRKIRSSISKKAMKGDQKNLASAIEEAVRSKIASYSKIPDSCLTCEKSFDKTSREQVFSWMMQINEEEDVYNLYCPECFESATQPHTEEGDTSE